MLGIELQVPLDNDDYMDGQAHRANDIRVHTHFSRVKISNATTALGFVAYIRGSISWSCLSIKKTA